MCNSTLGSVALSKMTWCNRSFGCSFASHVGMWMARSALSSISILSPIFLKLFIGCNVHYTRCGQSSDLSFDSNWQRFVWTICMEIYRLYRLMRCILLHTDVSVAWCLTFSMFGGDSTSVICLDIVWVSGTCQAVSLSIKPNQGGQFLHCLLSDGRKEGTIVPDFRIGFFILLINCGV